MSEGNVCPLCSRSFLTLGCVSAHLFSDGGHRLTKTEVFEQGYLPSTAYNTSVIGRLGQVKRVSGGPKSRVKFRVGLPGKMSPSSLEANHFLLTAGLELTDMLRDLPFTFRPELHAGVFWTGYLIFRVPDSE